MKGGYRKLHFCHIWLFSDKHRSRFLSLLLILHMKSITATTQFHNIAVYTSFQVGYETPDTQHCIVTV